MKAIFTLSAFLLLGFYSCQEQNSKNDKVSLDEKIKLALEKEDFTDSCFLSFKFGMNQNQYDSTEKELIKQEKLILSENSKNVYYYFELYKFKIMPSGSYYDNKLTGIWLTSDSLTKELKNQAFLHLVKTYNIKYEMPDYIDSTIYSSIWIQKNKKIEIMSMGPSLCIIYQDLREQLNKEKNIKSDL
jgi:hypothetical protein